MPLLAEYGLIPDLFDSSCYSSADLCDVHLQNLKEALLADGIVRNLRNGDWLAAYKNDSRTWHKRGTELLKKLVLQNRLRLHPKRLTASPTNDVDWCHEAVASHSAVPLQGVITNDSTWRHFRTNAIVAPITRLAGAKWWKSRGPSVRLGRTLADYEQHLALILACANSAMFIDAHLDPSVRRYSDAVKLICKMGGRSPQPLIELHRVCYIGTGQNRQIVSVPDWETNFRQAMCSSLAAAGLSVKVLIWDDFHDRHIISELIGIGMLNGLDTTTATTKTTWHRLSRSDRDDIQREFDPACNRHSLRGQFVIP